MPEGDLKFDTPNVSMIRMEIKSAAKEGPVQLGHARATVLSAPKHKAWTVGGSTGRT